MYKLVSGFLFFSPLTIFFSIFHPGSVVFMCLKWNLYCLQEVSFFLLYRKDRLHTKTLLYFLVACNSCLGDRVSFRFMFDLAEEFPLPLFSPLDMLPTKAVRSIPFLRAFAHKWLNRYSIPSSFPSQYLHIGKLNTLYPEAVTNLITDQSQCGSSSGYFCTLIKMTCDRFILSIEFSLRKKWFY